MPKRPPMLSARLRKLKPRPKSFQVSSDAGPKSETKRRTQKILKLENCKCPLISGKERHDL